MKRLFRQFAVIVALALGPCAVRGVDIHINAGAQSQAQGTPLYFQNGGSYDTNSSFVLPLLPATSGPYAGHFFSGWMSFTAIGDGFFTPPALGTQVRLRFVSVSGPAGGSFGVWDVPGFNDGEETSTTLTFSVPAGTTNGTSSILLSQNHGEPNADPFGHIHGRIYSATKPGLYVVTLQAYDASANGTDGGSIHQPSALLSLYFHAGVTITSFTRDDASATVTFPTALGSDYFVQTTTNLVAPNCWQDIAGPFTGNNRFQTATDTDLGASHRYYRLRVTGTP